MAALSTEQRESWEARCHFCAGPSYPWTTDDATWAKVEPVLGQQQACFECFAAAWVQLGHNDGEPFVVSQAEHHAFGSWPDEPMGTGARR